MHTSIEAVLPQKSIINQLATTEIDRVSTEFDELQKPVNQENIIDLDLNEESTEVVLPQENMIFHSSPEPVGTLTVIDNPRKDVDQKKILKKNLMHPPTEVVLPNGRIINQFSTTAPVGMLTVIDNPRRHFDQEEMDSLIRSIEQRGVIQSVLLRINAAHQLEVIAGGRRVRAAIAARGLEYEIPILIRMMTDEEKEAIAVIENRERANLTPTEEAEYAAKLLIRHRGDRVETALYLNMSRTTLDHRLALMELTQPARDALNQRRISLGIAELLATLTHANQEKALPVILEKKLLITDVRNFILKKSKTLASAIFDKKDCLSCKHNSDLQTALFSENIGKGTCSNGPCFDKKTEDELELRRLSLIEDYPVVKIIRPGDNYIVIALESEGKKGVGPEQALACKSCANFGGAVSALPDSMGVVSKDRCFDTDCNKKMVKAYAESLVPVVTEKTSAVVPASGGATKQVKTTTKTPSASKVPASAQAIRTSVKEYREAIWRRAVKDALTLQPEKSLSLLFGLAANGDLSVISRIKIAEGIEKLTGLKSEKMRDIQHVAQAADDLAPDERAKVLNCLTRNAVENVDISKVTKMMAYLAVDLKQHWKIDAAFLQILTKSEIEALAIEIGLKAFLDKEFSRVMSKPKSDIGLQLMSSGFVFDGVLPRMMLPPAK